MINSIFQGNTLRNHGFGAQFAALRKMFHGCGAGGAGRRLLQGGKRLELADQLMRTASICFVLTPINLWGSSMTLWYQLPFFLYTSVNLT